MKSNIRTYIQSLSTSELLRIWELAQDSKSFVKFPDLDEALQALMSELQVRDPAGYDCWICSNDPLADPYDYIEF